VTDILGCMKRVAGILGMAIVLGGAHPTVANQLSPAALRQRQLAGCMNKQMAASKTLSYNQASKLCKELIKRAGDNLTASEAPRPEGVH
jgi:hypothetical protein